MKGVLRQGLWLAVAAWLSWFLFLRSSERAATPLPTVVRAPAIDVTPVTSAPLPTPEERLVLPERPAPPVAVPAGIPEPEPGQEAPPEVAAFATGALVASAANAASSASEAEPELELEPQAAESMRAVQPPALLAATLESTEPTPPPSEPALMVSEAPVVARDEAPEHDVSAESTSAEPAPRFETRAALPPEPGEPASSAGPRSVESVMQDPLLLGEAREEVERGEPSGFETVLLARPEDQLEIARFFAEELVLVPRRSLAPEAEGAGYFRLAPSGAGTVEHVSHPPPLAQHRQYRDLFDYDYGRLPAGLRELRRSVLVRTEVYLFAALLSPAEWALVIARRREALVAAGRELADARRFVLRYTHRPAGGFDLRVDEIVFADGGRFRPEPRSEGE